MGGTKLDKKQLDAFKKDLLKMREDILADIKGMSSVNSPENQQTTTENAGHSMHMADVATDLYDREFNLGLASNDRELLKKVEDALKRIDDGTFGVCLKTKKNIPITRLKAIPYAEYTVEAQEEMEKEKGPNKK